MKVPCLVFFVCVSTLAFSQKGAYGVDVQEVTFETSDNIKIYSDLFVTNKKSATIILFHQARSSARGEYASILLKLAEQGFNVLAVDQRSGGDIHGVENRTASKLDKEYGYCDAFPDLEASIAYLNNNDFAKNYIAWGSSYSAALVIQLGAKNADVKGIIAFSPASGGPMADCKPEQYFEKLKKPLLILRPPKEAEIESVKNQLELAQKSGHQTFVAKEGSHGSSMLVPQRFNGDATPTWNRVLSYLRQFLN